MHNLDLTRLKEQIRSAIRSVTPDPSIVDMPSPPELYAKPTGAKTAGILMAVAGFGIGGIILFSSLIFLLVSAFADILGFGLVLFGFNLVFAGGFGFLGVTGASMAGRVSRFLTYKKTIGDEELCNIRQLADRVGKSTSYVAKDVEKMIRKGWFCQGHLDRQRTCLMVTDRMYQEYQRLEIEKERNRIEEEELRRRQAAEAKAREKEKRAGEKARAREEEQEESAKKASRAARSELSPKVRKIIEQGGEYVKKIRLCNDAIPGEVVSAKIVRMEVLVDRIFDRVEQRPECVSDIRKLMEYYLPITIKLLEIYAEMDAQPVGGENIQSAKKEIEESLDTINLAFEKLLDDLFQDDAWDVSSDISVLKTMLAQEGLSETMLNGGKENGKRI